MLISSAIPQAPPTAIVDSGATAARGQATEIRSDIPPVQQGDGVRYTRGRPSDNDTYNGLANARRRSPESAPAQARLREEPETLEPELLEEDEAAVDGDETRRAGGVSSQGGDGGQDLSGSMASESVAGKAAGSATLASEGSNPAEASGQSPLQEEADPVTGLTSREQSMVEQLQARDREVRLHELAHQAAGGQYAGSANYEYQRGPDGKRYAVGGEVSISVGATDDPRETLEKARQIRAAALAPAQPSGQDRMVAMQAERMMAEAQTDIRMQEAQEAELRREARAEEAKQADAGESARETAGEAEATPSGTTLEATDNSGAQGKESAMSPAKNGEVSTGSRTGISAQDDGDNTRATDNEDKPTARESLEKILLAKPSLAAQANALGYISPDKPAGDSGLLDLIV